MKGLLYLVALACALLVCAYAARPCKRGECQKLDGSCVKKGKDEEQCVRTFCRKGMVVRQKYYGCRHNGACIKFGKLEEECTTIVCRRIKNDTFHGMKKMQRFKGCALRNGQCIAFGKTRNETACVDSVCEKRKYGLKYRYIPVPYGCPVDGQCVPFGEREENCKKYTCSFRRNYKTKERYTVFKTEPLGCPVDGQCVPFGEREENCKKYTCSLRRNYKTKERYTVYKTEPLGCLDNDVCIPFGEVEDDCRKRICAKVEEDGKTFSHLWYEPLGCRRNDTCVPFGTNDVNCRRITCTKIEDGNRFKTSYQDEPIGCTGANGGCYGPDDGPFPGVINGNTYDTCRCSYEDGIYKKTCTG